MELIASMGEYDETPDTAQVLNDLVAWVLQDGAAVVAQYCTLNTE